jgi:predicted  nucleic acid-binding Zn-ribbon protein
LKPAGPAVDKRESLEKEKSRLERTIQTLEKRLSEVEEALEKAGE